MTRKLTKVQTECLEACADWSAPYEVMWRRHERTGEIVDPTGNRNALGSLRNLGHVEYSMANDTFRITPAGRRVLEAKEGKADAASE